MSQRMNWEKQNMRDKIWKRAQEAYPRAVDVCKPIRFTADDVIAELAELRTERQRAERALLHFERHGDLCYAQRFLEATPRKYTRQAAFKLWLRDHCPVTMKNGKLLKDKSENAVPFDVKKALDKPFWEYAANRE